MGHGVRAFLDGYMQTHTTPLALRSHGIDQGGLCHPFIEMKPSNDVTSDANRVRAAHGGGHQREANIRLLLLQWLK